MSSAVNSLSASLTVWHAAANPHLRMFWIFYEFLNITKSFISIKDMTATKYAMKLIISIICKKESYLCEKITKLSKKFTFLFELLFQGYQRMQTKNSKYQHILLSIKFSPNSLPFSNYSLFSPSLVIFSCKMSSIFWPFIMWRRLHNKEQILTCYSLY